MNYDKYKVWFLSICFYCTIMYISSLLWQIEFRLLLRVCTCVCVYMCVCVHVCAGACTDVCVCVGTHVYVM